jgi:hypothetical protein
MPQGGARPNRRPRHGPSLIAFALGVMALGLLVPAAWAGGQGQTPEYSVKAAYLAKFGAFVEWPDAAFAAPASPLVLCILGDNPFGGALDQTVGGQRIGQRPIEVRRLDKADRTSGCHILYLTGSRKQSIAEALRLVRGAPVLTVTDDEHPGPPGVIHFTVRDNHVRFTIDADMAAQDHLNLSSKLLSVAVSVRNRP